ncbi:hypothetical protein [Acidocella sp.]|uniref:hypothetical protein n=1 Tax=Acidocella sp. TaxID=50710 RepID=UPI00260C96D5|nr:hypothetical protein [Acidocella sp.]MDD2796045.1 hypothetical protein [Acidocella sp.]
MILRGLFMLARGQKAGINEFSGSMDAFTASLAPLIAFPLVGAGISALNGQWAFALLGLFSRICAVLVLPVIVFEFARWTGREALWMRTATALNWAFWMLLPVLFAAAFVAAVLMEFGLAMLPAEIGVLGLAGLYLLWYHWFIMRAGLSLSGLQALGLLLFSSLVVAAVSAAPVLVFPQLYTQAVQL